MKYVQDTRVIEGRSQGVFLWHAVGGQVPHSAGGAAWYVTRCKEDVIGKHPVLDQDMSLRDWDAMFGPDVDLCECAVDHPDDLANVASVVEENTSRAH